MFCKKPHTRLSTTPVHFVFYSRVLPLFMCKYGDQPQCARTRENRSLNSTESRRVNLKPLQHVYFVFSRR